MEVDLTDFFIGGTYKHKSYDANRKVCDNWWPQIQRDPEGKSTYLIETFPGTTLLGPTPGTSSRGSFQHKEEFYQVVDTTLYRMDDQGNFESLGTVSGGNRCSFASVGTSLITVSNGTAYEWDGTTLTAGTDPDFGSPNSVAGLNNRAYYDFGSGQTFSVSEVGDYLNISSLNYGSAEVSGDDLVAPYVFQQTLRPFGKRTVEAWWNTPGVRFPPVERIQGSSIPVGLGARHGVCNTSDNLYFFGHDDNVYAIDQNRQIKASTPPMVREISTYQIKDDAVAYSMDFQGDKLIFLNFPSEGKTWVLQEGGEWFNLSNNGSWVGDSYAYCYGKHLVSDTSGNVLEVSDSAYENNGTTIKRNLQSSPIHSGLLGKPGKRLELNSITIELTTGQGLVSGQGQKPRLMLSISENGGRTFGTEYWYDIGKQGEYREKVTFSGLGGTSDSRVVRIQLSDPVYCSIHRVLGDVNFGI